MGGDVVVKFTTRHYVTVLCLGWFVGVAIVAREDSLSHLNVMLVISAVPMVWLLWELAWFWVDLHAGQVQRAVEKVHGTSGRPQPLPHQEVTR
jgi:hypothetical protein